MSQELKSFLKGLPAFERFGELGSNADDYRNMATKARSTGDALAWTEEA